MLIQEIDNSAPSKTSALIAEQECVPLHQIREAIAIFASGYCYGVAVTTTQAPLTDDEKAGIILAAQSAFTKLKNLHRELVPIFQSYGFTPPSPGVIARDLSEKIETSIVQHCTSFSKGAGHCDLSRHGHEWEVKICKDSGLTINQSKQIRGENYIVVNYKADSQVTRVFVVWDAIDAFFSPRRANANARALIMATASAKIEILFAARPALKAIPAATDTTGDARALPTRRKMMAKAGLGTRSARRPGSTHR